MNETTVRYRTEGRNPDIYTRRTWTLDQSDTPNVDLLRQTLEFVTEHRNLHDQGRWFGFRDTDDTEGTVPTDNPEVVERVKGRLAQAGTETVPALPDEQCGTTGCLFGWAAVLGGGPVTVTVIPAHKDAWGEWVPEQAQLELDSIRGWQFEGADLLDLNYGNAEAVSAPGNSLGDLWRMASIITGGAIVVPAEFASYDGLAEAADAELATDPDRCYCGCED